MECWPHQLRDPTQEVRFLNNRTMNEVAARTMQVTGVQREVPEYERKIHCKSVELPLNYHERIIRYTLRVPPRTGEHGERLNDEEWLQKCRRYLKQWMDLIIVEKKRQMHLPEDLWPPWPPRSSALDVMTMPIVMWLSKAPKETTRKRKREGQTCPAPPAPSHAPSAPPLPPPPPPAPCHAGYANYYIMNTSGFGMSR